MDTDTTYTVKDDKGRVFRRTISNIAPLNKDINFDGLDKGGHKVNAAEGEAKAPEPLTNVRAARLGVSTPGHVSLRRQVHPQVCLALGGVDRRGRTPGLPSTAHEALLRLLRVVSRRHYSRATTD